MLLADAVAVCDGGVGSCHGKKHSRPLGPARGRELNVSLSARWANPPEALATGADVGYRGRLPKLPPSRSLGVVRSR